MSTQQEIAEAITANASDRYSVQIAWSEEDGEFVATSIEWFREMARGYRVFILRGRALALAATTTLGVVLLVMRAAWAAGDWGLGTLGLIAATLPVRVVWSVWRAERTWRAGLARTEAALALLVAEAWSRGGF